MLSKLVFVFLTIKTLDCVQVNIANARLNFFDIDLLRHSVEDQPGNIVISPASIKAVLAMLLEGAKGKTAMEIKTALRVMPNKEDYREQLNVFMTALKVNGTKTQLELANSIFVANDEHKYKLKKEYETMLKKMFCMETKKIDFRDAVNSTNIINDWVKNKTRGLISHIVDPTHISPTTSILLANAIYFKSSWKHSFSPRMTHSACFYNGGICRNVAMMELQAELKYAYVENLRAHAVELPYENNKYSMVILVPQDKQGLEPLIRDLPYMSLDQISTLMYPNDVILSLPRFTVDYREDMVPVLIRMKIRELFTASSNLSGMFENHSPQVSNIYHKVHIEVNEEGTLAAAATGALVIPLIGDKVTLNVDRPFLFFIRDNDLGLVLFEGKIEEPSAFVATPNDLHDTKTKNHR